MSTVQSIFLYTFSFLALYVQVFLLVAAFFGRKNVIKNTIVNSGIDFPGVTIVVPCWNEEKTVIRTIESLKKLDYPQDKLFIKIIDDGSTDGTWKTLQKYAGISNIELIKKENGGKHTAMNLGISTATTDFIGCLDADAFVSPDALKKIMTSFNKDPEAMAVVPSVLVHDPKGFFQKAQQVEYDMGVFTKKILSLLGGIHVTPGPFSIYRLKVFKDLGPYVKAHSTEDMEIAYRMQVNSYKIIHCHDAYIHTVTPNSFVKLYKQRIRWMYGFINNSLDYKHYMLKPKYGTFSLFTVPTATVTVFGTVIMSFFAAFKLGEGIYHFIQNLHATDFYIRMPSFSHINLFFFDVSPISLIMLVLYVLLLMIILIGQKMRNGRMIPNISILYFVIIFSVMGPLWLIKATYNTVAARETAWR